MLTSARLVTWRREVPPKPCWAKSSSAAPRIRSLVENWVLAMWRGCLLNQTLVWILGAPPGPVNGRREASENTCRPCIRSVRITPALSAKPAPRRGFFCYLGCLPWSAGPAFPENPHGAGAHPFHHQARRRRQERHRRDLFPFREGRPEGRRREDEAAVARRSRRLLRRAP